MVKPAGWPRYMKAKRLSAGATAYYWIPQERDRRAGFSLHAEPLGQDYATAIARAGELNAHLDAWRLGRGASTDLDLQPGAGTLDWLVKRYYASRAWDGVSLRARPAYRDEIALVTEAVSPRTGARAGSLRLGQLSARFADLLYDQIKAGGRGGAPRVRQANVAFNRLRRAWDVVGRLYPDLVPNLNPFAGVEREHRRRETRPATRAEAYALAAALEGMGHVALGFAALACFEWHQRPEHVVDKGVLSWPCWRPPDRPRSVRIEHPKTGAMVWMPLEDEAGLLFPEIEVVLARVPRRAVPIVVVPPVRRATPGLYSHSYARALVRKARRAAGLPEHVTLAACRHGGMTELGDAELPEAHIMSLSGHRTPDAARLYIKRTETQRLAAARRRRAFLDAGGGAPSEQPRSVSGNDSVGTARERSG